MAPDIFLYPGEASPTDVKLTDPTQLAGGVPPITGVSAVTQAAGSLTSTISETFSAVGATTQATATCASVIVETFLGLGGSTQAAAVAASTVVETFSGVAASTQAKATPAATLTETVSAVAASTQAPATLAATVRETFSAVQASTQGVPVLSASGVLIFSDALASTQAAATISAQLALDNGSRTLASASTQAVARTATTLHADWPVFRGWASPVDQVVTTTGYTGRRYPVGQFPGTFLTVYTVGTTQKPSKVWPNPTLVNADGSFRFTGDALTYDLLFWRSATP